VVSSYRKTHIDAVINCYETGNWQSAITEWIIDDVAVNSKDTSIRRIAICH